MDPFSSALPLSVVGKILGSIPLKNFPILRCVSPRWKYVLNRPEVWQEILKGLTVADCRWLSRKRHSLVVMKEMFICPQFKVSYFIADSIHKEIFFPPFSNLEDNLIKFLLDHKFILQTISTFNTPDRIRALDICLTRVCERLKSLKSPIEKRWTLPQILIKSGMECSFLVVIGLIDDADYTRHDPLGHDLLYWAILKNCNTVVLNLLERGVQINASHVLAASETGNLEQIEFILRKGETSLLNKDYFEICKKLIENHRDFEQISFLLNYCRDKLTSIQFNDLAEVAYKAQSIAVLDLLIRQYQANVKFIEMLESLHTNIYPAMDQDRLDNLLYDMTKNNIRHLNEYLRFNLVYFLASLGAIRTFALIFPYLSLDNYFIPGQKTPLHAACAHMHTDFARALIKQRDGKSNDRDEKGNTPWHLAFEGYKEMDSRVANFIEMMLEVKGDYHAENNEKYTPLDLAQMNLGNNVLHFFPAYREEAIEITGKSQFNAPLWIILPRMQRLRCFTAKRMNWYVKSCSESYNAFQLQDMTNVNRHAWTLPSVDEINVANSKFFAYSWIHLFKSFPKATKIDFSGCRFTTYDPFQDQIRFLESVFKELTRNKCRINLYDATFHDKPIILTPKQIAIFREKFPWLVIDGNIQSYQYTSLSREEALKELMKESEPVGSFRLHPSDVRDVGGNISCDEISFKTRSGRISNHLVRIHPVEDFLLHYKRAGNWYDTVDVYPNIFVFLNTHQHALP